MMLTDIWMLSDDIFSIKPQPPTPLVLGLISSASDHHNKHACVYLQVLILQKCNFNNLVSQFHRVKDNTICDSCQSLDT